MTLQSSGGAGHPEFGDILPLVRYRVS